MHCVQGGSEIFFVGVQAPSTVRVAMLLPAVVFAMQRAADWPSMLLTAPALGNYCTSLLPRLQLLHEVVCS